MKAQVMLDKSSDYLIVNLEQRDILVLRKSTETGDPFVVVAGNFLKQMKDYGESVLAEIETVQTKDYSKIKKELRDKIGSKNTPITFW
ncbi:MAG: hypothetical protein ACYCQJ_00350 [Nitrososphaerales archaeon]